MSRQDIQGILLNISEIKIDLKSSIQNDTTFHNEFLGLKTAINDISVVLRRDILPSITTINAIHSKIQDMQNHIVNINGTLQDIQYKLNYTWKPSSSQPMDIDEKIEKLNQHQEEIYNKLSSKLTLTELNEKLDRNYYSIEKSVTTTDISLQKTSQEIKDFLALKDSKDNFLIKLSQVTDKLLDIEHILEKINTPIDFKNIINELNYIKILIRDSQKEIEQINSLKEILKVTKKANLDDINKQLNDIFKETFNQTDFSLRLAEAIRIEIRDRLKRIEENMYKFITNPQNTQESQTLIHQTQTTKETFVIYSDKYSPDKSHFIL